MTQRFAVFWTETANADIERLYDFLVERDFVAAQKAKAVIFAGVTMLQRFPFTCRKAARGVHGPRFRELVIPFGSGGYVALFEIDGPASVTVLAVRHQREEDYH